MLNQCNFIGRLTRDPESRFTQSGKQVTSFSIACSEKRGGEEFTEFINLVAWEKLAEISAEYLRKGSLCYVSGKQCTRKWEKDGVMRYTTEIILREMKMLSPKAGTSGGGGDSYPDPPPMGDDVPFS